MISRTCWKVGSKRRLWRMKRAPGNLAATFSNFFASDRLRAIGFSRKTFLPALSAMIAWAVCSGERVAISTSSTEGSAMRSSILL